MKQYLIMIAQGKDVLGMNGCIDVTGLTDIEIEGYARYLQYWARDEHKIDSYVIVRDGIRSEPIELGKHSYQWMAEGVPIIETDNI